MPIQSHSVCLLTRNGHCGGSRNGACEVYPEKDCI
ncbi:methylenetetrahydrofolate reductase C-terminal domain-containing protein [Desulfopila sp. IMCC35006]